MHLTRQVIDLVGCIGFAVLAAVILYGWFALRRVLRQMRKLS